MNSKYLINVILIFDILFVKLNYSLTKKTSKNQRLLLLRKKRCTK